MKKFAWVMLLVALVCIGVSFLSSCLHTWVLTGNPYELARVSSDWFYKLNQILPLIAVGTGVMSFLINLHRLNKN